jgi:hypothetical protein
MMDTTSLGQIAYEAYGTHQGWWAMPGGLMPGWPDLVAETQAAWEAAGQAVAQWCKDAQRGGE